MKRESCVVRLPGHNARLIGLTESTCSPSESKTWNSFWTSSWLRAGCELWESASCCDLDCFLVAMASICDVDRPCCPGRRWMFAEKGGQIVIPYQ